MEKESATIETQTFDGKIGITLVIIFVLLSIIPVTVLMFVVSAQVGRQAIVRNLAQQESQAEVKINDLRRWLQNSQTTLVLVLANDDQRDRVADILASNRPLTTAVTLQTQFLEDQLAAQTAFTEFFMFNRDGIIRVSTDASRKGVNIAQEPYFEPALAADTLIVQHPFWEEYANGMQMFTLMPIIDANGEHVGAFAGRLNMDVLSEIMTTRVGLGNTGETYLVNSNGLLVTPSRSDEFDVGDTISSEIISMGVSGENGSGEFVNYRGVRVLGAYRWVPSMGVLMVTYIEREEALGTLANLRTFTILASAGLGFIAILIAIVITIWITRPIQTLTRVAKAVINEDYSQRAVTLRDNEIGQLAYAFNQMTDKLVNTIADLDQRVHELKEANQRAEEAVRLKDEFLAVMSHELRTPLNASIGFLGLLKMSGRLGEQDLHMVARARTNNERLLELINNILDLSRIEAGRMNLVAEPFDLPRLVNKLHEDMLVLADQKNLKFSVSIGEEVPDAFVADIDAVKKIISNLVSNAIKFTEKGEVYLSVNREGDDLVVKVQDTGVGIPAHMHDAIFDSFRQVDASSRRLYGGSGLGLSIVQSLTRALNGTVSVESTLGAGSLFTVRLPFITVTETAASAG